jgi:hypothetical protein
MHQDGLQYRQQIFIGGSFGRIARDVPLLFQFVIAAV